MNSNNFFQQEVSFYPKLILAKLEYDSVYVQDLLREIESDLPQEQILNTIIDILINTSNKNQRELGIKTLVRCLVDGSLEKTFELELLQLSRFFIIISEEIYSNLSGIFLNNEKIYKYINWNTGEIIFSTQKLNETLVNEYTKLYPH